jgi:hypothetical protein
VWVNEEASTDGLLGATERSGGARREGPPPAAARSSAMERWTEESYGGGEPVTAN